MRAVHQTEREILPGLRERRMCYGNVRSMLQDNDILLREPDGFWGQLIALATRGPFSHVSAALWWDGTYGNRLYDVGYSERRDGVAVPLSNLVEQHSGRIHVFRVLVGHDKAAVTAQLHGRLGQNYSWRGILRQFIALAPLLRWCGNCPDWIKPNAGEMFCSQFIATCYEEAGIPLVHKPADEVTPNDLADSPLLHYVGTLVATAPEESGIETVRESH